MRYLLIFWFLTTFTFLHAQITSDSLTLLFMGDIMGHDSQIRSALQADSSTYDYHSCFDYIKNEISSADLAIANLEVTLAGPPFKGYPQFSTPDALAVACNDAGIDVLVTANNHCADRRQQGLERTIKVLDSLNIPHTGTFLSYADKQEKSPLVIEKNNFKIAFINYTYGTNGIPVTPPSYVNINQTDSLINDIEKAKLLHPDAIVLFIHWGIEYQHDPNEEQLSLANICFGAGVNIIIGSHPHVVQKSIWENQPDKNRFVVYSLGNFICNQKTPGTDGGQMIKLKLFRKYGITTIADAKYGLTWIYGPYIDGKKKFYILPGADYEKRPGFFADTGYYNRMKTFLNNSRALLNSKNENVAEKP
jgi:poly-gamma-glutamate capsule biosynthesis protein CapA/YwtB (metallophosphatase superfamily)